MATLASERKAYSTPNPKPTRPSGDVPPPSQQPGDPHASESAFREHGEVLKDDVRTLKDDAAAAAREHGEILKEDLRALKDDAGAAAGAARAELEHQAERVQDIARSGGERVQEAHDSMCRAVRKNPTAAVLVTLGAGIMLGRLIGGR